MTNITDELAKLAQLRDQGVLSPAEFETQKAALLSHKTIDAPHPAPTKKSGKLGKIVAIVVGLLLLLMIIGAMAGGGDKSGETASTGKPEPAPLAVTAQELFKAYESNEAAAQQQYGDKPLMVSGTVNAIQLDPMNKPFVALQTANEFMSAQAGLTQASQAKASSLKKGQKIKILCEGVNEIVGTPMLHGCEIQ